MPSDLGIDLINNYLEHIDDVLHHFELEKGSPKDDEERKNDASRLESLQDLLIAIRNDEVNSEKEWEKAVEKLREAEAQEQREIWELVYKKDAEKQTTEIEVNKESIVAAVTNG